MTRVAAQQGKSLPPLTDALVATPDDMLGLDPFSGGGSAVFPVTIGDFIAA